MSADTLADIWQTCLQTGSVRPVRQPHGLDRIGRHWQTLRWQTRGRHWQTCLVGLADMLADISRGCVSRNRKRARFFLRKKIRALRSALGGSAPAAKAPPGTTTKLLDSFTKTP